MGCREKYYRTEQFVLSSCSIRYKWWASWISGVLITLIISSGFMIRLIILSQSTYLTAWIVGAIFVPTLALVLGSLSGNRRLFEAVYIALFYFGPINGIKTFDFLGITGSQVITYGTLSLALLTIGTIGQWINEKHFFIKKRG